MATMTVAMGRRGALPGPAHPLWNGGRKIDRAGYVLVYQLGHPRAAKSYVFEHVLIAERALGHALPPGAIVHHGNEVKDDNRNDNLAILANQGEHSALHARRRVQLAGGDPWTERICGACRRVLTLDQFYRDARRGKSCRECSQLKASPRRRADYHPHAKLTPELVRDIRAELAAGVRQVEIAQRVGVQRSVICRIGKGLTWRTA